MLVGKCKGLVLVAERMSGCSSRIPSLLVEVVFVAHRIFIFPFEFWGSCRVRLDASSTNPSSAPCRHAAVLNTELRVKESGEPHACSCILSPLFSQTNCSSNGSRVKRRVLIMSVEY